MLTLLKKRTKWRSKKSILLNELQVSIVRDYFLHVSRTCSVPELPDGWKWTPKKVACFKKHLKKVFLVPMQTSTIWGGKKMKKSQLIKNFLGFLHLLLQHNTDSWWRGRLLVKILEKELRFLHTILADITWMMLECDDHKYEAQFKNLMEEFEAVANQAGCFVHSMLFSTHLGSPEMEELAAAFHCVDCLKATLKSSDIFFATPFNTLRVSTTSSALCIRLQDLKNLRDWLQGEDDGVAEVKDQINLLNQGLILLHSSINDTGLPQCSKIGQLKEFVMPYIGNIANQAQHLIAVYLSKKAPPWYVTTRFTYLNQMIQIITAVLELEIKEC